MYNFIFYVMYCQQIQKGGSIGYARCSGASIVSLAIGFHFALVLAVIKKALHVFYDFDFVVKDQTIYYPFVFLLIVLPIFYFNDKKANKIVEKYSRIENPTSTINYAKVICIIFVPLTIGAILSTK